ncbi:hypothetical protein VA596_01480 [Amycolatopsis sp., V23-08]|uniref:Uncharacterized protein n=1 Tax=Amycolatopsis heterodermiae TaxID=3110235 RepID=A0ABU5QW98_9PSEU|nr:hypothetical protein [Amycolatopsis sp., V23-08]MEA5358192.1 hypothetical protein [Amycolatopsis sp., V23-08]
MPSTLYVLEHPLCVVDLAEPEIAFGVAVEAGGPVQAPIFGVGEGEGFGQLGREDPAESQRDQQRLVRANHAPGGVTEIRETGPIPVG